MKTFTDNTGRAWTLAINVDAIKRVKALLGVDLMEAVEGKLIQRLMEDPVLLCDVVYCLCKPQADAAKVSDEDFGRSMAGDAIELATTAMLEELVDFFPKGRRAVMTKALEKFRTLEAMALEAANKRLDSPQLQEQLNRALEGFGESSTSAPASSEPTPAP